MNDARRIDAPTEGLHPRAKALTDLLDVDLPMQVQHKRKRVGFTAICGSETGQLATLDIGITCEDCRRILKRRAQRSR